MKPSGYKQWIQRLFIHGRRRELGLGPVRLVTLAEALANRKIARAGGDPVAAKGRGIPTFEEAFAKVIEIHRPNRKNAKHAAQWTATLRDYVFPRIGRKRVDVVTAVLLPIWNLKHETARRVRQRIGAVMKWAMAQGYRQDNPAGEAIGAALPKNGGIQRHQRALPYGEVAGAIQAVQ